MVKLTPFIVAGALAAAARLPAQLTLVEEGGALDDTDLALATAGAVPFVIDSLPDFLPQFSYHSYVGLNDGIYGNGNSWIGYSGNPGFAGIRFPGLTTIASIAFGRDNTGFYGDRCLGAYTLQYTAADSPDATTPYDAWITIGAIEYATQCPPKPAIRNRYNFDPVDATGIRLLVPFTFGTDNAAGICIDELEAYADPGAVLTDPCVVLPELTLLRTGGPGTPPLAAAGDVPAAEEGNLARGADAVPFGTPPPADPTRSIAALADGLYGDAHAWQGDAPGTFTNKVYAGIYFSTGAKEIAEIAIGRDNLGGRTDAMAGEYRIETTEDIFDADDDAAVAAAAWTPVALAGAHVTDGSGARHVYAIGPVTARAVRIVTVAGNVIDEIELGGKLDEVTRPLPAPLRLLKTGGPGPTPATLPGEVATLEEGNAARAADAVPFGTPPFPAPAHTIPHLNDGLYGNANSWLGNEPGPSSGRIYAGIYFAAGPREIRQVAFGRDDLGQYTDRAAGPYIVQYSSDEFDPADDAQVEAAAWTTLGAAADHLNGATPELRRVYGFDPAQATAVRILTVLGNAIDEIEVGGDLAGIVRQGIRDLTLVEVGGSLTDDDLARGPAAFSFAIDSLANFPIHDVAGLTDGIYGNSNSWIGNSGNPGFAGINLGGSFPVSSIAFGRDNHETPQHNDRYAGTYTLQYTTVANPDEFTSDASWITIGRAINGAFCPPKPWMRHRYNFPTVQATGIRLIVPGTGLALGTCIDELEVYSDPGDALVDPCTPPVELAVLATGGPVNTPAAAADVPSYESGNVARAPDAVPFGSPPYPAPAHSIPHLNDGLYGNANSWLGHEYPPSGKIYAGIYFSDGPRTVKEIALGRDNTGQYADRAVGPHLVEYTTDDLDPADDASIDGAKWIQIGVASGHLAGPPGLRRLYGFDPVEVRAVRVRTQIENAIDEIELTGDVTPPEKPSKPVGLQATATVGSVALSWTANAEAVSGYNVYRSDGGGAYKMVNSALVKTTAYSDGSLIAGRNYCYEVRAVNAAGESDPSDPVCATPPPAAPANVEATGGSKSVHLTWNPVAGASGYVVYRVSPAPAASFPATVNEYLDTGLADDTEYCYRVSAKAGAVEGNKAAEECATTAKPAGTPFRRGDADGNGSIELTDAIAILSYMFLGGEAPTCMDAANADGNDAIELTDAIAILSYMFLGGDPPPRPGPEDCGLAAEGAPSLGCGSYSCGP